MGAQSELDFSDSDIGDQSDEEPEDPAPKTPKRKRADPKSSSSKKSPKSGKKNSPSKRVGRHKALVKKGHKQCASCNKTLELCKFAVNQSNCGDCKSALDVLAKKARQQGKMEWLSKTKKTQEVAIFAERLSEGQRGGQAHRLEKGFL